MNARRTTRARATSASATLGTRRTRTIGVHSAQDHPRGEPSGRRLRSRRRPCRRDLALQRDARGARRGVALGVLDADLERQLDAALALERLLRLARELQLQLGRAGGAELGFAA